LSKVTKKQPIKAPGSQYLYEKCHDENDIIDNVHFLDAVPDKEGA